MSSDHDIARLDPESISQDPRAVRGLKLAIEQVSRIRDTGDHWLVPSRSGTGRYRVDPDLGSCTCPDAELRGVRCAHVWAVEFVRFYERKLDGSEVVTEVKRVTYRQPDWPAYNRSQVEEGSAFRAMLASLCTYVEQPEQRRGRPRLSLADMAFSTCLKVYSGFSSRRFASQLALAAAEGYIKRAPHYNSLNAYLADPELTPVLRELLQLSALPLAGVETRFAIDATGFSTGRFERWYMKRYGQTTDRRQWVKFHCMIGVDTQIITAGDVTDWRANDSPYFVPMLQDTSLEFDIQEVSADRGYLSRNNVAAVEFIGAQPFIPFKVTTHPQTGFGAWGRMYHRFAFEREEFLRHYHQRSNVESAFSAIKRRFGDSLRTRTFAANCNETLAKAICHNLTVVNRAMHTLGIEAEFV
jgi:transposase